jgi:hypothetical protein
LLATAALACMPAQALAGDKPLVIESAKIKQLPSATTLQLNAPTTAAATINLPHGTAPTSPANGDCWTTTAGLYCRINGATVGPFSTTTGTVTVSGSPVVGNCAQFLGSTVIGDAGAACGSGGGSSGNTAIKIGTMRALTDFTQINISGSYAVTEVSGKAITVKDTSPGTGFKLAGLCRAVPAAPYRIVMAIQPNTYPVNYLSYAYGFSDGTKYDIVGQYDTNRWGNSQWSNSTTRFGVTLTFNDYPSVGTYFVALEDDNAGNVYLEQSSDGINFAKQRTIVKSSGYLGSTGYTNACLLLQNLGSGGASGSNNPYSISLREWDESGLSRSF